MDIHLKIQVKHRRVIGRQSESSGSDRNSGVLTRLYLFCFGLLEGKLHGGHSQLVGEEIHISGQLQRADVGSWAVPTANATQQLSLTERRGDEEKEKHSGMSEIHRRKEGERRGLAVPKRHRLEIKHSANSSEIMFN